LDVTLDATAQAGVVELTIRVRTDAPSVQIHVTASGPKSKSSDLRGSVTGGTATFKTSLPLGSGKYAIVSTVTASFGSATTSPVVLNL